MFWLIKVNLKQAHPEEIVIGTMLKEMVQEKLSYGDTSWLKTDRTDRISEWLRNTKCKVTPRLCSYLLRKAQQPRLVLRWCKLPLHISLCVRYAIELCERLSLLRGLVLYFSYHFFSLPLPYLVCCTFLNWNFKIKSIGPFVTPVSLLAMFLTRCLEVCRSITITDLCPYTILSSTLPL